MRLSAILKARAAPATVLGFLVLALLVGISAGESASAMAAASSATSAGQSRACSLSPAQERTALDAFDKMLPVLYHPRCLNCHGGVNPYADREVGRHLGGAMVDTVTGEPLLDSSCQDCHGELPGWQVPGAAMFFVGRSPAELCAQFKQFAPGGGADFVEHIAHEPNSPQFIGTAFLGTRALTTLGEVTYEEGVGRPPVAEPPPGTRGDLARLAQDWVDAVGAGWTEDPDCGCTVRGAWHGSVTASGNFHGAGMPGDLLVSSSATVMLEPVPTPRGASGNRVQYYHATGGMVQWHVFAVGPCRGSAGGTFPLDTLGGRAPDGKPLAQLRLEDVGAGEISYRPSTGSWTDRWSPFFFLHCDYSGTVLDLPMTNLQPTWWMYDLTSPPSTTNPDLLEGSYTWVPGPGSTITWRWSLRRVR
jgi:hypothetical protein